MWLKNVVVVWNLGLSRVKWCYFDTFFMSTQIIKQALEKLVKLPAEKKSNSILHYSNLGMTSTKITWYLQKCFSRMTSWKVDEGHEGLSCAILSVDFTKNCFHVRNHQAFRVHKTFLNSSLVNLNGFGYLCHSVERAKIYSHHFLQKICEINHSSTKWQCKLSSRNFYSKSKILDFSHCVSHLQDAGTFLIWIQFLDNNILWEFSDRLEVWCSNRILSQSPKQKTLGENKFCRRLMQLWLKAGNFHLFAILTLSTGTFLKRHWHCDKVYDGQK